MKQHIPLPLASVYNMIFSSTGPALTLVNRYNAVQRVHRAFSKDATPDVRRKLAEEMKGINSQTWSTK